MVTAIIQARAGSTRLKNKMLLELHGHKIIEWVLIRVRESKKTDHFFLAIPDTEENNCLAEYGNRYAYNVFRGSENDVLSRFYLAAQESNSNIIVRICADNPLISAVEIDRLIDFFCAGNYDYAYNHIPRGNKYPDGLGAEIISFELLKIIYNEAILSEHREHIFDYIWENRGKFKIGTFDPKEEFNKQPQLKLDIDTIEDFDWFKKMPLSLKITSSEIIKLALANPRKT